MKTGIFYAVGVGTEPLDLTLRAKQVLETAEVLVTPITRAGEPSAAARIAEQVVSFSGKEIIPLLFPMQKHLDYRERLRGELLQPIRDCLHAGIGAVRHIGTDESRKSVAVACSPVAGTAAAGTYYHAAKYRHGRGMDWNANRRADLLFYHPHHPPSTEQIEKGNRNNGLFCRSWSR